jgi:hypothetical protein
VQSWSTNNQLVWTPSVANPSYSIKVETRSSWNLQGYEALTTTSYAIKPVVTAATLTASPVAPRFLGTTVVWSASASGGEAPYQYQFVVWDGIAWKVVRAWDTSATYSWTPATANAAYQMAVWVRGAWNTGGKEFSTSRPFAMYEPVTSVTLTPDVAAPQLVDHTITFTAAAAGGQSPYQYRWLVDGIVRQDWSNSTAFAWTPDSSGWPQVKVQVRGASPITGASEKEAALAYEIREPLGVTLTSAQPSPRPTGSTWPIQWTANLTGGSGLREVQWAVYDGTSWSNLTPWITESTNFNVYNWSPTVPLAYRVAVRVRNAGSTGPAEAIAIQPFVIQ